MELLRNIAIAAGWIFVAAMALAATYITIWIALFFPISKNRKLKEQVAEYEKEYNKIKVESAQTYEMKQIADEELKTSLHQELLAKERIKKIDIEYDKKAIALSNLDNQLKERKKELSRLDAIDSN